MSVGGWILAGAAGWIVLSLCLIPVWRWHSRRHPPRPPSPPPRDGGGHVRLVPARVPVAPRGYHLPAAARSGRR